MGSMVERSSGICTPSFFSTAAAEKGIAFFLCRLSACCCCPLLSLLLRPRLRVTMAVFLRTGYGGGDHGGGEMAMVYGRGTTTAALVDALADE